MALIRCRTALEKTALATVSSFAIRGAVLAGARLLNQVLGLLSPLILVRLLEISEYGRYRQFMATAMFVTSLAGFALSANLNYLLARSPERTSIDITNACLLMFAVSVLGALIVVVSRGLIVPAEISAAWPLLTLYVLLFLNLDVLVSYWLANGRSLPVLYYTLSVTVLRLTAVIGATVIFRDVILIFVAIVCAEAIRGLAVYAWLRRNSLLVFQWNPRAMAEQLRLVIPLGAGAVLSRVNEDAGKLVVGNELGAVPLAIYTTAGYQVPLVNIVQGALADVIFPDMVKRSQSDPLQGLQLWKRAQALIFSVICPAWLFLTYFAEPLIRLLFTDAYAAATPYFQVFLLLMVRQCFLFSTPLRSVEDNASFARANALSLAINIALIVALMPSFGLWGPTLGLLIGQTLTSAMLGRKVMTRFQIPLSQLCAWRKLGLSLLVSLLALAALHGCQRVWPNSFAGILVGVGLFAGVYAFGARLFLREEYEYVMRGLTRTRGR